MKIKISGINKGAFTCTCGKHLSGNDVAIIHENQNAITCEECAEKGDKRLFQYDCRIQAFLQNNVVNAVPETVMVVRRNNFRKSFDKVNAAISNARVVSFVSVMKMNVMEQIIFLTANPV